MFFNYNKNLITFGGALKNLIVKLLEELHIFIHFICQICQCFILDLFNNFLKTFVRLKKIRIFNICCKLLYI